MKSMANRKVANDDQKKIRFWRNAVSTIDTRDVLVCVELCAIEAVLGSVKL